MPLRLREILRKGYLPTHGLLVYHSTAQSCRDIATSYQIPTLRFFYDSTHLQSDEEDPIKLILGESSKLRDEGRNSEVTIYDLSPTSVDNLIDEYGGFRLPWNGTPNGLGKLCFPATTPQILDYRRAVGEKMHALPEKKREKVLSSIVDELMYWERSRSSKVKERIPEMKDLARKERNLIRDERRERWENRVREIFNI